MPTSRWMEKEAMVHIYNGISLSCTDEHIWVGSNEVDEPRACYTERNKPEGEEQLLWVNACTWRKMVRMSLCSGQQWRCRRACGRRGGREGGTDGRGSSETRPSPRVKQAVGTRRVPQGLKPGALGQPRGCAGGRGEGGDTCIPVAGSCLCMAEASTTL